MQRSFLTILGTLIVASGLALAAPASAQECETPPPASPPNAEVPAPTPDKPTA